MRLDDRQTQTHQHGFHGRHDLIGPQRPCMGTKVIRDVAVWEK